MAPPAAEESEEETSISESPPLTPGYAAVINILTKGVRTSYMLSVTNMSAAAAAAAAASVVINAFFSPSANLLEVLSFPLAPPAPAPPELAPPALGPPPAPALPK